MKNLTSKKYYDKIAEQYNSIFKKRKKYLDSIDKIICHESKNIDSYLDIGGGDGSRTKKISSCIDANFINIVEESKEMAGNFYNDYKKGKIEIINQNFFDFSTNKKYDLITALWNVMGHIISFEERIKFLKKTNELLSSKGIIILDINNRYNIKHYGIYSFLLNSLKSIIKKEPGWFNIEINKSKTPVYIHSLKEMKKLIKKANLSIDKLFVINYDTGTIYKYNLINKFKGQLLFILTPFNQRNS
jgi:trans-aconitate methyltransferase